MKSHFLGTTFLGNIYLQFLGNIYLQFNQPIPTIPSEDTLCNRGCEHKRRVPAVIDQPQTPCSQMSIVAYKYRGASYYKAVYY